LMMIKSLKQRLTLFLILPVALMLILTGLLGFYYTAEYILNGWKETAVLKLQRAAHHVDMRLSRPLKWIEMFHETAGSQDRKAVQQFILERLRELDGVTNVSLTRTNAGPERMPMMGHGMQSMMPFHQASISDVTPPRYDIDAGQETVTLISELKDVNGGVIGKLDVSISFVYLIQDVLKLGWWQSEKGCLVDDSGRYLAHTEMMMKGRDRLGGTGDPVELGVLEAMKKQSSGTVFSPGYPPRLVSGFCRISEAPWVIVLFAPGNKVLAPIIRFSLHYALAVIVCIGVVILLIRLIGGTLVRSITEISRAAAEVAKGRYGSPLATHSADEVGQLVQSFNAMVEGLKERDFISNTFGRYVDQGIAKELMKKPSAAKLGGEKREVAILISDIRDFTPLSESLPPEAIVTILNHYFSHMIEVIQEHDGIIVDFFGDGVLVFFDPFDSPIGPVLHRTIQCALGMQARMGRFNAYMQAKRLPELQIGIGVNSGEVIVGNIGSETRAKYGIVGSAVNITQRIQCVAKGNEIVISDSVYQHLGTEIIIEKSLRVPLKGLKEEETLHLLGGMAH